ncbi:MAG: 4Fe-4S binding protein, partial [Archaeoglobaceae archaeon]
MITVANYCVGCAFCMLVCPEEAVQVLGCPDIDVPGVGGPFRPAGGQRGRGGLQAGPGHLPGRA